MVNWTNHGSPLRYQSFSWATGKAWAPHGIERNGRFYMYVPVSDAIGVAVADGPIDGTGSTPERGSVSDEAGCTCASGSPTSAALRTWLMLGALRVGTHRRSRQRRRLVQSVAGGMRRPAIGSQSS